MEVHDRLAEYRHTCVGIHSKYTTICSPLKKARYSSNNFHISKSVYIEQLNVRRP